MKKRIGVIFGGYSSEYPVSLQSAAAILDAIDREIYEPVMLGITRSGNWLKFDGTTEEIRNDSWFFDTSCVPACISTDRKDHGVIIWNRERTHTEVLFLDAVFPILHGKNGEDGSVQGLCALAGIPVIGCGIQSSALCMDKHRAHLLAKMAGIEIPIGQTFKREAYEKDSVKEIKGLVTKIGFPVFVKPVKGGSSFGITKVETIEQLDLAITKALEQDEEVLIEEAVAGFEVGCAILGTDKLTVGKVDEIELAGGFFNYTEKYQLVTSKIHMPARITEEAAMRIQAAAVTIYRALGCSGFARVDLFLKPDGTLVFNEVNTIPGFTAHSRFPNMMKGIGLSFEGLVNSLMELAELP